MLLSNRLLLIQVTNNKICICIDVKNVYQVKKPTLLHQSTIKLFK